MTATCRPRVGIAVLASAIATAAALFSPAGASAAFPGRNGKIAYTRQIHQSSAAIYTVSPSGGSGTNLSGGNGMTADFQPAWSATGKQIAFVRVDFQNCSGQIWTMNANGSNQTNLSNDPTTANEFNPAYGPDGSIVFVRAAPGTFNICSQHPANSGDLWVRSPNGSTHQLTTDGHDNTPALSPDGSKIAFTRLGPGGPHIFTMNANGKGIPKDLGAGLKPNWSPDGTKIVFAAPGVPNGPSGGPVTVMNADGSHRKTLNSQGTAPAWSPDGTQIVYITFDQANNSSELGVMDANGQHQHTVTNPGSNNSDVKPDWQPLRRHLHLSVTPHRTTSGHRTCFHFRATSSSQPVAGVKVLLHHHRGTTGSSGRAGICVALAPGTYTARATKPSYTAATAQVKVRRAHRARKPHRRRHSRSRRGGQGFTG